MLVQQTQTPPQITPFQFSILDVRRVGDWLTRECPACRCSGYVNIYPNREPEAMAYITREDWTCKPCVDIQREVDHNFYGRGGDSPFH